MGEKLTRRQPTTSCVSARRSIFSFSVFVLIKPIVHEYRKALKVVLMITSVEINGALPDGRASDSSSSFVLSLRSNQRRARQQARIKDYDGFRNYCFYYGDCDDSMVCRAAVFRVLPFDDLGFPFVLFVSKSCCSKIGITLICLFSGNHVGELPSASCIVFIVSGKRLRESSDGNGLGCFDTEENALGLAISVSLKAD